METVTIEIKSSKAMRLLKDLERLDIIKIHQSAEKPATKDKASKYRASISPEDADQLMGHVKEIRNEWDERFRTI
jgi:hypothetical protein